MRHTLADDHTEIDRLLEDLFAALETIEIERIYQALDFFWVRLAMHIRAEHLHLFPAISGAIEKPPQPSKTNNFPSLTKVKSAITELQADHNFFMRELLAAIKQMRNLRENKHTADFSKQISNVRETIDRVRARLERHNQIEETEVYRWAELLLSLTERAALDEQMQKEITNLPPRFGDFVMKINKLYEK